MRLAKRIQELGLSQTASVMEEARRLRESGIDVIDFGPGEPDLPTPDIAGRAAIQAVRENFTHYTAVAGIGPLREAIARRLSLRNGPQITAEQVIVTCGAKQAIYNLCCSLFDQGDEVLIPRPYWVTFPEAVRLAGAEPRFVATASDTGFIPRREDLEAGIGSRTRGLIVNYPNNPSGAVLGKECLREIAGLAREKGIFLLSDETYDAFCYRDSGSRETSFLSVWDQEMEGLAVVGSFSKTFSMTGWRVGYAVASPGLVRKLAALQSHATGNASSISQKAALAVLDEDPADLEARVGMYRQRRDLIADGLDALPGVNCPRPEGAFYVFPEVSGLMAGRGCRTSAELAGMLLREEGIAVVPGSAFGFEGHLRFSYAVSTETIQEGLERLRRFCRSGFQS